MLERTWSKVRYFLRAQRAKKFKKVQAKKLVKSNESIFFREIAFLAVLNFFPVQKLIFHSNLEHVPKEKKFPNRFDNKFIEFSHQTTIFH